ncbi:small ribosomal subunit protein bS6m [Cylas formicarius]|uniref:small ribosomal subunit protein bS6m n=1 Tax=Cylas formicarius TaxID=197179 RepID=UPI0029589329|nr:small ribosomal subunit protein bS6m [Cylas formicarius]
MINYELLLLLRVLPKPELKTVLRRAADCIFNKGGIIRKLENLGTRDMPYKTSVHGVVYNKASYFLFLFNVPPSTVEDLLDEYSRDVDIIRRRIYKKKEFEPIECTLDDENKPPPYREEVQELMRQAKKLEKPKFQFNTGLDYYPFQK